MARSHHKSHAGEYAALKARAQAAGMSVRAFKAARASNARAGSFAMYAPRAQKTVSNREHRRVASKSTTAAENLITKVLTDRHGSKPGADFQESARLHVGKASRQQLDRLFDLYDEQEDFYIPDDEWDELGFLLYYRD